MGLAEISFPLFVPADRPERISKAIGSGADCVIVDLEDAVAPQDKVAARNGLLEALTAIENRSIPILVRVNAAGSCWHDEDLAALGALPVAGAVLPKAEQSFDLERLASVVGDHRRIVALIESALGLAHARHLAQVAGRLAFGSLDFAAALGCSHTREALLVARTELVLASRLAGLEGPIDGVTETLDAPAEVESDAAYALSLGFAGKLLIHPKQVAPARRGFAPTESDVAWARRVVAASRTGATTVVGGTLVDAPVLLRARQILQRAQS